MFRRFTLLVIVVLALAGCGNGQKSLPTPPADREGIKKIKDISLSFEFGPAQSKVHWGQGFLKGIFPDKHYGTVEIQGGGLVIEEGKLTHGVMTVDLNTIRDEDETEDKRPYLEAHLKSPDFFDAEQFPTAALALKKMTPLSDDLFEINGDLTIKGVTHPITFKASGWLEDGSLKAYAHLELDRKEWGIRLGGPSASWLNRLKDLFIYDTFKLDVELLGYAYRLNKN